MSIRQKSDKASKKLDRSITPTALKDEFKDISQRSSGITSEWDYKLALAAITTIAFVTRFWGINHPNEVVFDEVHFGKVRPTPDFTPLTSYEQSKGEENLGWKLSANEFRFAIVCLILSPKDLLLRCSPSVWKASICPHGLVRRI